MKHAVALIFSLLLILGDGVFARPAGAAASNPADHGCGMEAAKGCARCACCVAPSRGTSAPVRETGPAPSGHQRLPLPAGAFLVLLELSPDGSSSASAVALSAPLRPPPVPLFLRHRLLII